MILPKLEAWIEYVELRHGDDGLHDFSVYLEINKFATDYNVPNWGRIDKLKKKGKFALPDSRKFVKGA